MINFTFNVDGQKLECTYEGIVADSIKYLNAVFNFSDEWEGLQKYVHFTQGTTTYDMIIIDDKITAERGLNISEGMWHVSLHGSILEDDEIVTRITTNVIQIYVEKSGVIDGDPFPDISPTIGEQIIAQATEKANAASESATSANTSKTAAETAAQTATTKAGDASTYASQALAAKNEAAGSAQTASAKAGEASASAIAAAASAASCEPYDDTEIRGTVDELGRDVTALYEDIAQLDDKSIALFDFETCTWEQLNEAYTQGKYLVLRYVGNSNALATLRYKYSGDNAFYFQSAYYKSIYLYVIRQNNTKTVSYNTMVTESEIPNCTKSALTSANTSANAWSDAEKANACQRIGAYNPNKEWVLKGTLTTENKDTGVSVDLSGCTELMILAYTVGTDTACHLTTNFANLIYSISRNGSRKTYARFEDGYFGFECINGVYTNSNNGEVAISTRAECYNRFDGKKVSGITDIHFTAPAVITSCNIEIYAR